MFNKAFFVLCVSKKNSNLFKFKYSVLYDKILFEWTKAFNQLLLLSYFQKVLFTEKQLVYAYKAYTF